MSRPRFLADHDFRGPIINGVQRAEPACEILLVRDLGLAASPDEEVLEAAANDGLLLLSHDRNTMIAAALARMAQSLPVKGLFIAKPERPFRRANIDSIVLIWATSEAEEWEGKIEYLPY